jgi:3-deoxy-D-manno-octulosonic acid kinase
VRPSLSTELTELGFRVADFGRRRFYLAPEIADHAAAIDSFLTSINRLPQAALGNRRSAYPMAIAGLPPMFVRRYLRGGMMRHLSSELYLGQAPRPLHELAVTAAARKRGLPIVEPMGAGVQWVAPGVYRGWFLTRALEGETLWQLLLERRDPETRRAALIESRASIDRLHEGGLYHADLNFHNLFVCAGDPRVVVLDLDKARLYPGALAARLSQANFRRLSRSARRLEQAGARLTSHERTTLGLGNETR